MMKRKSIFIMMLFFAMLGSAYADLDDACEAKKDNLKVLLEKCKTLKGQNGYNKCAADFKKEKAKYQQACSGSEVDDQIKAFIQYENDVCVKNDYKTSRCAVTVRNLGKLYYQLETQDMIRCEDDYSQKRQEWEDRDKKGPEPKACKREYDKSLGYFNKFMAKFPDNAAYPSVLMQASYIYMSQLKDEDALKLWMELVDKFPSNDLAPKAWLRIGEYHYNNRKNSDAIAAYKKAMGDLENLRTTAGLQSKEKALLIYHLAESYNNMGDFKEAAKWFFTYIIGADRGDYPPDLRPEALTFMAGAFADMDNGIDVALEFLSSQDPRVAFEDTLYFEIGMKNLTRDRLEEAAYSFKRLLEINPVYVDAPIAHVQMITILEEKQKFDEAQEARKQVVELYNNQSDWYRKNSGNQDAIASAREAIRGAYFQIPAYHHRKADKLDKEGDTEASKAEYGNALGSYDKFMQVYPEPHWDKYKVHMFKAVVYGALKDYRKQAAMYNWIADVDTLPFGRRPKNLGTLLTKNDAAYNAVVAMDKFREEGVASVNGDKKQAYALSNTKEYLAQVEKFLGSYGSDPKNEDAAELAYNAALVHYEAEEYQTSVKVLTHLKKVYPEHKYIKFIRGNLARAMTQAGMLDEAEKEYEELLPLYPQQDTMYVAIERSIAAVQFQKAERLMKNGQYEKAAVAYLGLQKRFPRMTFSDKAVYEAGEAYLKGGNEKKAVATFMSLHKLYPQSELAIKSILKTASVQREKGQFKEAAETFLVVTKTYPKDSMAFKAIGFAASAYDTIPNKKLAAETFELTHQLYPQHPETPSFLYTACRTYEDGKMVEDAIRCNKIIITDYATSSYAVDAGYSIPKAYEKAEKWSETATAYQAFLKQFGDQDPGKFIAANYGAAKAYANLKDTVNTNKMYEATLVAFDSHGAKINADPTIPAEAAFALGKHAERGMDPIIVKGSAKEKGKLIGQLTKVLQKATEYYAKSATYNSEKWTFKATNQMGYLFVNLAAKVRDQEIEGSQDEVFAEKIGVVQTLPSFYEKAEPLFQKNIDVAREQGYYNKDVIDAEEGYIEMFYQNGYTFEILADAFENAPVPDVSGVPEDALIEELYGMGFTDEEIAAGAPAQLWMDHYKNTLLDKANAARQGAVPKYENCIKAGEFYKIKNEWSNKCTERLKVILPESEALNIVYEKFDATNLFQDKVYFSNKTRIEQIFGNEIMSEGEKIDVFKAMLEDAKKLTPALEQEFKELDLKLHPPVGPDGKPIPAGTPAQ